MSSTYDDDDDGGHMTLMGRLCKDHPHLDLCQESEDEPNETDFTGLWVFLAIFAFVVLFVLVPRVICEMNKREREAIRRRLVQSRARRSPTTPNAYLAARAAVRIAPSTPAQVAPSVPVRVTPSAPPELTTERDIEMAMQQSQATQIAHIEKQLIFAQVLVDDHATPEGDASKEALSFRAAHPKGSITIRPDNNNEGDQECAICLQAYEKGDTVSWSHNPDCHHAFHKKCALDWLSTQPDCPVCRRPYIGRDF